MHRWFCERSNIGCQASGGDQINTRHVIQVFAILTPLHFTLLPHPPNLPLVPFQISSASLPPFLFLTPSPTCATNPSLAALMTSSLLFPFFTTDLFSPYLFPLADDLHCFFPIVSVTLK